MKVSWRDGLVGTKATMIGSLSSWLIGTSVVVASMLIESVIRSRALEPLVFVVVLVPIVGALLFPGALVVGGAAGCLALQTARSMSRRMHAASFALLGAVIGLVYASILVSSIPGIELQNPSILLGEAGLSGAVVGAVVSMLVQRMLARERVQA